MMIGQDDILNNDLEEVVEEFVEEESSMEELSEKESSTEELSEEESSEEESSAEESSDEESSEVFISLSLDDVPITASIDSLGLIGITCIVIIYLLGILVIIKKE